MRWSGSKEGGYNDHSKGLAVCPKQAASPLSQLVFLFLNDLLDFLYLGALQLFCVDYRLGPVYRIADNRLDVGIIESGIGLVTGLEIEDLAILTMICAA